MSNNTHLRLLEKYKAYANTEESRAVVFIKEHLRKSAGHWVDIEYCESYEQSENKFHFKIVEGGLYKRKLKPEYPPKSDFTLNGKFDEDRYYLVVRAITWETANLDIEQQKKKRVKPINFEVTGVCYDKNRNNPNFFRDDAPPEIKELAKNLSDRTHRLWDKAMRYVLEPEFVYKIKNVRLT